MSSPLRELELRFGVTERTAWRKAVDGILAGADFQHKMVSQAEDCLEIAPLYTIEDALDPAGAPGAPPYLRGPRASSAPWQIVAMIDAPDRQAARGQVDVALRAGAEALKLRFDRSVRDGVCDGGAADGLLIDTRDQLDALLAPVDLGKTALLLDAGANALPVVAALIDVAEGRGIDPAQLRLSSGQDPLGALARDGRLATSLDDAFAQSAELCSATSEFSAITNVSCCTSAYRDAGANAANELAYGIATAIEYLRQLTAAGLGLDHAASQVAFCLSVSSDIFVEIAKLRAARLLWANAVRACGGNDDSQRMRLHTQTARRYRTKRDSWNNMLRATGEVFAAAAGGAESIAVTSFTLEQGIHDPLADRVACTTQQVLREESHLHRVVDPAGGSWFIERLTLDLAQHAWQKVQAIERAGGMIHQLQAGTVQAELAGRRTAQQSAAARGKLPMVGATHFALLDETTAKAPPQAVIRATVGAPPTETAGDNRFTAGKHASFSALAAASALAEPATIAAIEPALITADFDELRDRADAHLAAHGHRPALALIAVGSLAELQPRIDFARTTLAAGGIELVGETPHADAAQALASARERTQAGGYLICASDATYAELLPSLLDKIDAARPIAIAGPAVTATSRPIHALNLRCDRIAVLQALQQQLGVEASR